MDDLTDQAELLQDFLGEAEELVAALDNRLLALERSPRDKELLNAVFRDFHTLKGGAGFVGARELVRLCHLTEGVCDRLRSEQLALDPRLMDLILAATAAVRSMLETLSTGRHPSAAPLMLTDALEAIVAEAGAQVASGRVEATPHIGSAGTGAAPDGHALLAVQLAPTNRTARAGHTPGVAVEEAPTGPHLRIDKGASEDPALAETRDRHAESERRSVKDGSIRVDTSRLDDVLNIAGEIALAKNRLLRVRRELMSDTAEARRLRPLDETIGQLDALVTELQTAVLRARMQPVGRLFQKYPRLVRDLARQLNKEVAVRLNGEDTELDRNMIEALADPLLHLVRNALDHGVETPEERHAAGKPGAGTIVLDARQSGGHVVIEIADDGRGIRPELLRHTALEKHLLEPGTILGMDDRQAMQLLFVPGFSTKDRISSISGRGVGMDVVRTNIQRLNGRIDIASEVGVGTTITLALPLTLAILPVLVVLAGEQPFALPLNLVREIVPLDHASLRSVSGKPTCLVRGEALPLCSLTMLLGIDASATPRHGIVLQTITSELVLAVDAFVGREEVVVKPIDGIRPHGVSGASLSADGSIVLVLDVEALLAGARPRERPEPVASAA